MVGSGEAPEEEEKGKRTGGDRGASVILRGAFKKKKG